MKEINICKVAKILCTFALVAMTADVSAMKNKGKSQDTNPNYCVNNNQQIQVHPDAEGAIANYLRKGKSGLKDVVMTISSTGNREAIDNLCAHAKEHYYKGNKILFDQLNKDEHTCFDIGNSENAHKLSHEMFSNVIDCLKRGVFDELSYTNGNRLIIGIKLGKMGNPKWIGSGLFSWVNTGDPRKPEYYRVDNNKNTVIRCYLNFQNDGINLRYTRGQGVTGVTGSCYPEAGAKTKVR